MCTSKHLSDGACYQLARWAVITVLCLSTGLFAARLLYSPYQSVFSGWDNSFNYFWLRSFLIDGDVDFENEIYINNTFTEKDRQWAAGLEKKRPKTDKIPNKYGIGWAILSAPYFLLADGVVYALGGFNLGIYRDGFNLIYQVVIQSGQFLYAVLSLVLTYKICRFWFSSAVSLFATVFGWAASSLLYYQTVSLSMAHSATYFLVAAIYYICVGIWYQRRERASDFVLLFLMCGILCVTRYQAIVYLLFPLITVYRYFGQGNIRRSTNLLLWLALFFVPIFLQLLAWKMVYGSWMVFTYGQAGESFNWLNPRLLKILFSPRHGWFYWHPLLLPGILGALAFAVKREKLMYVWLVSALLTYYVNASWHCWWLGGSFGARGFEACTLVAVVGLAFLLTNIRTARQAKVAFGVIVFFVVWNFNLCLLYCANAISRNGSVAYSEMARSALEFYPQILNAL